MELRELDIYRYRDDLKLDELVDIANSLVELVAPKQPSDRGAERLNERTLRYYITKGLVDRPIGKEGTAALYSYRHLAQILALKRLQAAYLPIKRIKEVLRGKSNDDLKRILTFEPEEQLGDMRESAISYLDSLLSQDRETYIKADIAPPALKADRDFRSDRLYRDSTSLPQYSVQQIQTSASWERFTLDDGVELHIRSDRVDRLRGSEVRRVVERILNLLKQRSKMRKKRK